MQGHLFQQNTGDIFAARFFFYTNPFSTAYCLKEKKNNKKKTTTKQNSNSTDGGRKDRK